MRILCIGDSNTWGFNPENGLCHKNRWTRVLMKLLLEDEIIEEGLNGRTFNFVDPFHKERCGINALPVLLKSQQPVDLVIVMLGTNDLKRMFHARAKMIASGAQEFIHTIKNPYWYRYLVPKVLMISPIVLDDEIVEREGPSGDFDGESLFQSHHLAEEYEKVCQANQVEFMNAAQYAHASKVDCIHMDEENRHKLAIAICNKIHEIHE